MRKAVVHSRQTTLRTLSMSPRVIMTVAFGGISVVNYAFGLVAGWLLVPGDFGLLAFAQTLLLLAGLVLDSGVSWSLTVAMARATEQHGEALVRGALVVNLLVAAVVSIGVAVTFALGPLRAGLETRQIAILVALCMPFFAALAVARAAAQGISQFVSVAAIQVVEIVGKAISGVVLMRAGFGATGAIAGFLIGGIISAVLSVYVLARVVRVRLYGGVIWPSFHAAGAMSGAVIGMALVLNLGLFALKLLSGGDRALTGYYQVGAILANAPYFLVASAIAPVLFTQLAKVQTVSETREHTCEALRFVAILILPIEVMFIALPEPILTLFFPRAYAPGAAILRLLAVGNGALILVAILSVTFQAVHAARIPARVLVLVALGEAATLCFAVPAGAAQGAAIVFVVASCLALLTLSVTYLRMLETSWHRPLIAWVTRFGLLIAGSIVVLVFVQSVMHNALLAGIAGGACYVTAIVASGLVNRERLSGLRHKPLV